MGAVQDGLGSGTLDDVLFIVHIINNGLGGLHLLLGMFCTVFDGKSSAYGNICYKYVYPTLFCVSGKGGWMDALG